MARVTVYLPDSIRERVVAEELPISKICQTALLEALQTRVTIPEMIEVLKARLDVLAEVVNLRTQQAVEGMRRAGYDPLDVFSGTPIGQELERTLPPRLRLERVG